MTNLSPLVSIIILTWNRLDDLLETILEIKKSSYTNIEIIVVDNASQDKTAEIIKKDFLDITCIELKENVGIAGYNIGFKESKGEYIVFLDSDSYPTKKTIEKMVVYFQNDKTLGVCAFDVNNYNYSDEFLFEEKKKKTVYGIGVTGYNGAGVGFRKDCLNSAGLLFEKFFLYMNEQEHSIRILKTGYQIKLFPDLIALHKQSDTSRSNELMAYYYTRNLLWLVWMHYPFCKMLVITIHIFNEASIHFIRDGTLVYLKAVRDAIRYSNNIFCFRSPAHHKIIKKVRIPFNLPFTVYK